MGELFYTEEEREAVKAMQREAGASRKPITQAMGAMIIDALGEQQNTLQIIARILAESKENREEKYIEHGARIKRGEVYFADLSGGEGSEQKGRRPVVIIQNDTGNAYSPTVVVVPATSQTKKALSTHAPIHGEPELDCRTIFMAEQIQTIDKRRLGRFVCRLKEETMDGIEKAARISLGIKSA